MVSKNINLPEMSDILGYDIGNLSRVLNGKSNVSKSLAEKVKDKTGIILSTTPRPKIYKKHLSQCQMVSESQNAATSLVKNKFEIVRKRKKLTNRDFAELIGIGETAYSRLKNGNLPTGEMTVIKIEKALPEYSIDWLLYGIEPELSKFKKVLIPESHYPPSNAKILPSEVNFFEELGKSVVVPIISVKARATFNYDYYKDTSYDAPHITIHRSVKDAPLRKPAIIEIDRDGMEPQLQTGARVLAEEVDKGDWAYITGVVAVCFAGQFVVKRIKENLSQVTGAINLYSDNPNGGGFMVKVSDIKAIWKVIEVISSKVE